MIGDFAELEIILSAKELTLLGISIATAICSTDAIDIQFHFEPSLLIAETGLHGIF